MNKPKQFIICGASTAGKSTFSHELIKLYHVQHIQIDPIIEGFEEVFPQLGITHDANSHSRHIEVCQKFKPFLFKMIDGLDGFSFAIEGFRMPLFDLYEKYGNTHAFFVFGYTSITAKEKLEICRKYDVDNWTNALSDDELIKILEFLIAESILLKDECNRLGIHFFDTSHDYCGQIEKAIDLVKKQG